ncbi:hypothetical protein ACFWWC_41670 [Streptomyces sp. NPDC058642]
MRTVSSSRTPLAGDHLSGHTVGGQPTKDGRSGSPYTVTRLEKRLP